MRNDARPIGEDNPLGADPESTIRNPQPEARESVTHDAPSGPRFTTTQRSRPVPHSERAARRHSSPPLKSVSSSAVNSRTSLA